MTMWRWLPLAIVLLLGPGPVSALDITTCGVTVPRGEVGTVQADLACQPGDIHAVALEDRAVLQLSGHTISNPAHFSSGAAIRCITDNDAAGDGIDIRSHRRPRLFNTTCGRSGMDAEPFGDWDVCAND
jgi:hypothetical protein